MRYQLVCCMIILSFNAFAQRKRTGQSCYLSDISWKTAATVLTPSAVVVIPLGAAAKEHGPHLPLSTDLIQANWFAGKIALIDSVVIAPIVSYSYYPPFLQYPGSTSLRLTTSRDMLLEIIRALAAHGPKRFYVINQGITTTAMLAQVAVILRTEGIVLYYSDYMRASYDSIARTIRTRVTGTHADELETSHILLMAPAMVHMELATDDTLAKLRTGPSLSPVKLEGATLSPTGIFGYATRGSRQKGESSAAGILQIMEKEIDSIRHCVLPSVNNNSVSYGAYTGTFGFGDGNKMIISFQNNQLQYALNGQSMGDVYPLLNYSHDRFGSQLLDVFFVRNDDQKVVKAICTSLGGEFVAIKKD